VIEVAMREENVAFPNAGILNELVAEWAHSRAAVEDQEVRAATDLNARRVATVADGFRARAGDASSHTPKTNAHDFTSPAL
jgi:hypothetical protein